MEILNESEITFDLTEIEIFAKEKGFLGYYQKLVGFRVTDEKKLILKFLSNRSVTMDSVLNVMINSGDHSNGWLGFPLKKASPEMSVRLHNTLNTSGVKCFAELTEERAINLIKNKEFGKVTFRELEKTIKDLGGSLNNRMYDLIDEYKPSILS